MASTRTTFTLDAELARKARELNINVSDAARKGVAEAVRAALAQSDRAAYEQTPETPDPFWDHLETWTGDDKG